MGLNIKNEATCQRARKLARLAGETMTQAVDRAIAERLERIQKTRNRGALVDRLLRIGRDCARLPVLDKRSPEEMLYDEKGLPITPDVITSLATKGRIHDFEGDPYAFIRFRNARRSFPS
jgi:antitoxin VapB